MLNYNCYKFELIKKKEGVFDNFVDATYIITLEGNNRIKNVHYQLLLYHPTKKIYIVHNKGYKKCKKDSYIDKPPLDLCDANLNILYHSKKNNFNNILILEDDFIFNNNINDTNIINNIELFFYKNKDKKFIFNLGPIILLFYPNLNIFNPIYKTIHVTALQAVIYNKHVQNDILNRFKNIKDITNERIEDFQDKCYDTYFYKYPLCYQIFPVTENSKIWDPSGSNLFVRRLFNLDKSPLPCFSIMYTFAIISSYLLFVIIPIIIIFCTLYFLYIILNQKKK